MDGIVFGLCALVGLAGTALSAREAWRQRSRNEYRIARFARTVAFGVCTVGVTFAIPSVAGFVDSATGLHNAAKLGAHLCAILWCGSLQLMLVDWSYNQHVVKASLYARIAFTICVLAAMMPLFIATTDTSIEFTTQHAVVPGVTVYLMIYLSYVAITCGEIAFLCSGMALSAREIGHIWAAKGLGVSAAAAILGVAYAASKGSYLVTHYLGRPWPLRAEEIVSPALAGLAVITLITGLTLSMVGKRLASRRASSATV
ncbi:hypothetical protein [Streptomyces sp. NPDC088789]|uniref:hypothetical protein n=1 Tax=Streptomyces sp. NPDC088789 TaxID=3365899 RepID=UPI003803C110